MARAWTWTGDLTALGASRRSSLRGLDGDVGGYGRIRVAAGQPGRTVSLRQEGVLRRPMTLNTRCSSDLFLNRMGGMATAATRSAIFL